MANGIAQVTLAGNIVADPNLVSERLLTFSVAVNRREKDSSGEYQDAPHYFDVKVLGNRAAPLADILGKGRGVTIQGDLVQERWEAKEGGKRSAVRVLAREVVPHGRRDEAGQASEPQGGGTATPDDDIPFAVSAL